MSIHHLRLPALLGCAVLAGCTSFPTGPSMMALPGAGVSFEQFRADDYECQSYAAQATGLVSPQQAAENSGMNSAAVGTAVGAAAGALLGAATGDAGAGAAIGAGSGLIVGSSAGSQGYYAGGYEQQARYDSAYIQCMYAKGHQVPVPGEVAAAQQPMPASPAYPSAPPPASGPAAGSAYPPPGTPPPPGYR